MPGLKKIGVCLGSLVAIMAIATPVFASGPSCHELLREADARLRAGSAHFATAGSAPELLVLSRALEVEEHATSHAPQQKGFIAVMAEWFLGEGRVSLRSKPVEINGIDAYSVDLDHSSLENELVRAERVLSEKNGGHVYLQKEFTLGATMIGGFAALVKVEDGKHIPAAVFRRSIAKHPMQWAGTIWHEVTHAGNFADALKGIDVARLRTFHFEVPEGSDYRLQVDGYSREFRIDEIQARAVEVGVLVRNMREAMQAGDHTQARKLEREINFHTKNAAAFAREADRQVATLLEQLKNDPAKVKITRKGAENATVLTVEYEMPYYSEQNMGLAGKMLRRLTRIQGANATAPIKMVLLIDPKTSPENHVEYLADFLERGRKDYRRFDKTFKFMGSRMSEVLAPLNQWSK